MQYLAFLLSSVVGFFVSKFISHPNLSFQQRFPEIKIKIVQVVPRFKIFLRGKTIHIHHWITYSIILIITIKYNVGFLDTLFSKGLLTGIIFQGLTYPDWKKIIKKETDNPTGR